MYDSKSITRGFSKLPVLLLLGLVIAGCQSNVADPLIADAGNGNQDQASNPFAALKYQQQPVVHHDDGGRVKVELSSAWSDDGMLVIRGIFTPDDAGFHLYSCEMSKQGVDGIGRPTLIEVEAADVFTEIGPLVSSTTAISHHDETLNMTFSFYPDGAVTLYLPLRLASPSQAPAQLPVKLTYMSCSDMRCNAPVEAAVAEIPIAASIGAE